MSRRITVVRKAGPRSSWGASLEEQVIHLSAKLVELEEFNPLLRTAALHLHILGGQAVVVCADELGRREGWEEGAGRALACPSRTRTAEPSSSRQAALRL